MKFAEITFLPTQVGKTNCQDILCECTDIKINNFNTEIIFDIKHKQKAFDLINKLKFASFTYCDNDIIISITLPYETWYVVEITEETYKQFQENNLSNKLCKMLSEHLQFKNEKQISVANIGIIISNGAFSSLKINMIKINDCHIIKGALFSHQLSFQRKKMIDVVSTLLNLINDNLERIYSNDVKCIDFVDCPIDF